MRKHVAGAVLTVTAITALLVPAGRSPASERRCQFIGKKLVCINVAPGGEAAPVEVGSKPTPPKWKAFPYEQYGLSPLQCLNSAGSASGVAVTVWVLAYYPTDPSRDVITTDRCEERDRPRPPLPPTPEEALAAAPLPKPVVNVSPDGEGATGMETWLWGADYEGIPVTVTLRGYTVSGVARPTEWRWHMGDMNDTANPPPLVSASRPGSRQNPAARYTYETKGAYTVTHSVVWSGSFTVTGWGLNGVVMDAGEVTVDSSRPYTVVEIRAVRRTPESSR